MRILYATDGSDHSLAGAELLTSLPLESDWEVVLLTVLPADETRDAEGALGPARAALRHLTATLSHEVRRGQAAEEILRAAEERPTGLIVVGSRGLHALARFFLGSVAERVTRHASCPVLLARPLEHGLQRVVLGVDSSTCATRAAHWLRDFPLPDSCEVSLTGVLPPREAATRSGDLAWPGLTRELDQLYEQEQQSSEARLQSLAADFGQAGKRAVPDLETGDPAHTLIRQAEEREADLIVVGSHGLSAIDRFMMGSVSEKVMQYAHCSVLVVK